MGWCWSYKAHSSLMESGKQAKGNPMRQTKKQKLNSRRNFALKMFRLPIGITEFRHKTLDAPKDFYVAHEMMQAYVRAREKKNLLLLDIDGTVVEYAPPHLGAEQRKTRPYLRAFLKQVAPHYDIVLFTANTYKHAETVWRLHFREHTPLFFWGSHLQKGLKDFAVLLTQTCVLRIVDDDENRIPGNLQDFLIPIQTWTGTGSDRKLAPIGNKLIKLAQYQQRHHLLTKDSDGFSEVSFGGYPDSMLNKLSSL